MPTSPLPPRFEYSPTPTVSVILPVYNEADFIEGCLKAILSQDYPQDRLEVLVVDGGSTDNTRAGVEKLINAYPYLRLLDNPERLQAYALNWGIQAASGEIIIRVDGHTIIAPDYVSQCVSLLRRMSDQGVVNVGGLMRPEGQTPAGKAIAAATMSPFAVPTAFHHSDRAQFVDTVYLGAWPRKLFDVVGMFNPAVNVNEDYEFNYRTRQVGGKIYLSPDIRSTYFPRASFGALWRQYFRYGVQKAQMLKLHPGALRMRQIVAPTFVTALIGLPLLGILWQGAWGLWGVMLLAYFTVSAVAAARQREAEVSPLLIMGAFFIIHTAWGLGFWRGLVKPSAQP